MLDLWRVCDLLPARLVGTDIELSGGRGVFCFSFSPAGLEEGVEGLATTAFSLMASAGFYQSIWSPRCLELKKLLTAEPFIQ